MIDQPQMDMTFVDEISEFMRIIATIADRHGLQETSHAIGMKDSALSHALNGRKRRVIPIAALLQLTRLPGGAELLRFVARRVGLDVVDHVPPSVEENYIALVQVAREQLGGELHKGLLRAQRKRVESNRTLSAQRAGGDDQ